MKMTKRILAMALCLIMVMSLSVTAFAAGSNTITIANDYGSDYGYSAYQIFAGSVNDTTGGLARIQWGTGVKGAELLAALKNADAEKYGACESAADVAAVLSADTSADNATAIAFAEIAQKYIIDEKKATSTYSSGKHTINNVADGYYLVVNDKYPVKPEGDTTNTTVSRYILEVVRDVTVSHKGTPPTVVKKIDEDGELVDYSTVGIGDTVQYDIVATMPGNIDKYDSYVLVFDDNLSKGLTFKPETLVITVNGVEVTKYFGIEYVVNTDKTTHIQIGMDILALEYGYDSKDNPLTDKNGKQITVGEITPNTTVVVRYEAEVNEDAIVLEELTNDVLIKYDRDPNKDTPPLPPPPPDEPNKLPTIPDGETPRDEVKSYFTELTIKKTDGTNTLTGAEFTLEGTKIDTLRVTRETYRPIQGEEEGTHWKLKGEEKWTTEAPVFVDPDDTDEIDPVNYEYYDLPEGYNPDTNLPTHIYDTVVEYLEQEGEVKVKAFVGQDGKVTFTGLAAGTYKLTESVTPDGYNTIDPIEFTVTWITDDEGNRTFDANGKPIFAVEGTDKITVLGSGENANTLYGEIVNVSGTTLPSTGGIGTTLFYIFGGLMFVGAAVLLITKKRMAA